MLETRTIINPLREGMRVARAPDPNVMVIFGVTGDLAHRKLMPALYNLARDNYLPPNFAVVGFARRPKTDQEMRDEFRKSVNEHSRSGQVQPAVWDSFAQTFSYVQSHVEDTDGYRRLKRELDR